MRKMNDYRRFLTFVFLLMISGSAALAQELMKVAGLVVDQNADPLIGVTVRVQGDNRGRPSENLIREANN